MIAEEYRAHRLTALRALQAAKDAAQDANPRKFQLFLGLYEAELELMRCLVPALQLERIHDLSVELKTRYLERWGR